MTVSATRWMTLSIYVGEKPTSELPQRMQPVWLVPHMKTSRTSMLNALLR